jgi:Na+/H+ antiporter NhaC
MTVDQLSSCSSLNISIEFIICFPLFFLSFVFVLFLHYGYLSKEEEDKSENNDDGIGSRRESRRKRTEE